MTAVGTRAALSAGTTAPPIDRTNNDPGRGPGSLFVTTRDGSIAVSYAEDRSYEQPLVVPQLPQT